MTAFDSRQHTLAGPLRITGIGLRGGAPAAAVLLPAPVGHGRVFVVAGEEIPATVAHVVDTRLATSLGRGSARISLVEHLCAALYASGVDNVRIEVEGEEIPVLDGSAKVWVEGILDVGVEAQGAARTPLVVERPVEVRRGDSWARLEPGDGLELDVNVAFDHPTIGVQRHAGVALGPSFVRELAWARTFGFLRDAQALRAAGIALGASLDNTVVYDDTGVLNPDGLRAQIGRAHV